MEGFSTMLEAARFAASHCNSWCFAYLDEIYESGRLFGVAEIHDEENPADEDSFYVVSRAGAIGFCEDGENIDWLLLPGSCTVEDLPATYQAVAPQIKFCIKCGTGVIPGSRFCRNCGERLC